MGPAIVAVPGADVGCPDVGVVAKVEVFLAGLQGFVLFKDCY